MARELIREIVLDTETTGLDPAEHSIIEIGCLEIIDRRVTRREFHCYVNPGRDIDQAAIDVHGITNEMLRGKPPFAQIVDEFLAFVGDAKLVIHNADFDMGFLNAEFRRCGRAAEWPAAGEVIDSLVLARKKHPGQRNSLDALCKRYEVDNSNRELHGALLDSGLLAEVYLRMTGGQKGLGLEAGAGEVAGFRSAAEIIAAQDRALRVVRASDGELAAHETLLDEIQNSAGKCLWRELEPGAQ